MCEGGIWRSLEEWRTLYWDESAWGGEGGACRTRTLPEDGERLAPRLRLAFLAPHSKREITEGLGRMKHQTPDELLVHL